MLLIVLLTAVLAMSLLQITALHVRDPESHRVRHYVTRTQKRVSADQHSCLLELLLRTHEGSGKTHTVIRRSKCTPYVTKPDWGKHSVMACKHTTPWS
jgi:hypothetical protein